MVLIHSGPVEVIEVTRESAHEVTTAKFVSEALDDFGTTWCFTELFFIEFMEMFGFLREKCSFFSHRL